MESVQKKYKGVMPKLNISYGDGYIKQDGEATVYVITRIGKHRMRFNTGVSVHSSHWDEEKMTVRKSHPDHNDYNLLIQNTKRRLIEIFTRYRLQYRELSPGLLRKEYRIFAKHIDFHSFLSAAIKERNGELSYSSIKQYYVLAEKLKEFQPVLHFADIDEAFLGKFNRWLINKKKNSVNTRFNTFKNFKTFLNIARRQRLINSNPLEAYNPVKKVASDRVFLDEQEVKALKKLYLRNFLKETDQRILRHFLFMCVTGLRISDLKSVMMEDIQKDILIFTAYKTRERKPAATKIPLCRFARQLIQDESPHRLRGQVFNCFAEQTMRKRIKEIVKVEKINKDLSLHTARHTFATMFLRKTKNMAALQKLLGHTKIEMTMIYAHILTEDIEQEMNNAFGDL